MRKTVPTNSVLTWREIFSYFACFLLLVLYTNTFVIWAFIQQNVPSIFASWLPVCALVVVVSLFFFILLRRDYGLTNVQPLLLAAGGVCLVIALSIPDPRYPVKRIHVAQYFLLSLLVRYALAVRIKGRFLLWFTFLVTWMFGVHEELLQGLHPLRTYGLRDILVNGMAALGGAFIGGGAHLFSKGTSGKGQVSITRKSVWWLSPAFLALAVSAYLLPLVSFRHAHLPWWIIMPIVIWLLTYVLLYPEQRQQGDSIHGGNVLFVQAALLLLYPVLINVAMVEFN